MACARCNATPAEFFATNGDPICRRCFALDQQHEADARARRSVAEAGLLGAAEATHPKRPRAAMLGGAALMGAAVALAAAGVVFTGKLYFFFLFMFGAGFVTFAQGYTRRR